MTTISEGLSAVKGISGTTVLTAVGGTVLGGAIVGKVVAASRSRKKKSRKSAKKKRSKVRRSSSKRKSRKKSYKYARTAGKRKDRSTKRIRMTKNGQPYVIMKSGKARFISKSSARASRKRKGGRY